MLACSAAVCDTCCQVLLFIKDETRP